MSFTEFSYVLLQAYDFLQMFDRFVCGLQMGGSDQWGNITAGIDLIRKLRSRRVHGIVWPLLTTSAGTKFGKTEQGTVWLDPARTSPFKFYQFWLNVDDGDVVAHLKSFTYLSPRDIEALAETVRSAPERREAQRRLAREVTTLVHGEDHVRRAEHASALVYSDDITGLSVEDVLAVFEDVPSTALTGSEVVGEGLPVLELLVRIGLVPSKSEARPQARVTREQSIGGKVFLVRKGQRETHLIRLT
jgi:tyrosyl-tRNA synthetase